ncbi:unnamed protein product, partial [Prorocentrum cordatum]
EAGAGTQAVHRVGATAKALWGSAATGIGDTQLHGLRVATAGSCRQLPRGASVGLRLHSYRAGARCDPFVLVAADGVFTWRSALWDSFVTKRIMEVVMQLAQGKARTSAHPWRQASPPAGVAAPSAAHIGWSFETAAE